MPEGTCIHVYIYPLDVKFTTNYVRCRVIKYPLDLSYMYTCTYRHVYISIGACYGTCIYMYMEIHVHVHSTLVLRKQKEKKGKVTHPTIAQTNKHV